MRRLGRLTPMVGLAGVLLAASLAHGAPDAVTASASDQSTTAVPGEPAASPTPDDANKAVARWLNDPSRQTVTPPKDDYATALKRAEQATGVPLSQSPRQPQLKMGLDGLVVGDGGQPPAPVRSRQQPSALYWWADHAGQIAGGLALLAAAGSGLWIFRTEPRQAVRRLACVAGVAGLALLPVSLSALGTPVPQMVTGGTVELSAVIGALLFGAVLMVARAMRWVAAGIAMDRQHQTDLG